MTCNLDSDNVAKLGQLVSNNDDYTYRTGDDESYQEFLKELPASSLTGLTLQKYCMGPGADPRNFCWWLEHGLTHALGGYSVGNATRHLIYFDEAQREGVYLSPKLQQLGVEGALEYVLKLHSVIANATPDDIAWVDEDNQIARNAGLAPLEHLGPGRKLRLLSTYHPDEILPIHSPAHIRHFLKVLGDAPEEIPGAQRPVELMLRLRDCYMSIRDRYNTRLTPYGFVKALYSNALGFAPKKTGHQTVAEDDDEDDRAEAKYLDPDIVPSLNQILYGPPGTGKTYVTAALAVKIADPVRYEELYYEHEWPEFYTRVKTRYDELVEEGRIVFTTFHQSFSYEDFVEGIRVSVDADQQSPRYDIEPGIFKRICEDADKVVIKAEGLSGKSLSDRNVWKISLGDTQTPESEEIFAECVEGNRLLLGYGRDIDFSGCETEPAVRARFEEAGRHDVADFAVWAVNTFKNTIQRGDIVVVSRGNSHYRAIAEVVGDYEKLDDQGRDEFMQSRTVRWLKVYENLRPVQEIYDRSFMQKTLYGLKAPKLKTDVLSKLLEPSADSRESSPYVIIIDEINRGNISNIFGELITLLEEDKRKGRSDQRKIMLPYSKKDFQVPDNLFVIGTMNTADRSLAQLDLALRRRFSFIAVPPQPELLRGLKVHDVDMADLLSTINSRIEVLLDADHLLGHAYFLPLTFTKTKPAQEKRLGDIFGNNIIPLLQEYFFDDWERIRWVLNDHRKAAVGDQFIQSGGASTLETLFGNDMHEQLSDRRYSVNEEALYSAGAYQGIIAAFRA